MTTFKTLTHRFVAFPNLSANQRLDNRKCNKLHVATLIFPPLHNLVPSCPQVLAKRIAASGNETGLYKELGLAEQWKPTQRRHKDVNRLTFALRQRGDSYLLGSSTS